MCKIEFDSLIRNNIINCSDDIRNILDKNILSNMFSKNLITSWNNGIKLTFAIMTFNEERCIHRCINSIINVADEIIVIDTGSTDNTINIIKSSFPTVKIYNHTWKNDFSYIRNLFNSYSTNDWIFQLDADEYFVSEDDLIDMKRFMCILDSIPIEPKIISPKLIDHDLSETLHTMRIYKRDSNLKYYGLIHEELRYNNSTKNPYIMISNSFFHDGYKTEVIDSKNKLSRNLLLLEEMIKLEPENIRWYYFLAREAFSLNYDISYIKDVIEEGLKHSINDNSDFKIGLLCKLMELNLDNPSLILEYNKTGKEFSPNCMDTYYYSLISQHIAMESELKKLVQNNINEITNLNDPFSLINSNGDHIFLSWGWGYFFSRNYELAFMMWKKISSCDIISNLHSDLSRINTLMGEYFESFKE